MDILNKKLMDEIAEYLNVEGVEEYSAKDSKVKSIVVTIEQLSSELHRWGTSGAMQPDVYRSMEGMRDQLRELKQQLIDAIQLARDREVDEGHKKHEQKYRQREADLLEDANRIFEEANALLNRANSISERSLKVAESAEKTAKSSRNWSIASFSIAVFVAIFSFVTYLADKSSREKEILVQLHGTFKSEVEEAVTKDLTATVLMKQSDSITELLKFRSSLDEHLQILDSRIANLSKIKKQRLPQKRKVK